MGEGRGVTCVGVLVADLAGAEGVVYEGGKALVEVGGAV